MQTLTLTQEEQKQVELANDLAQNITLEQIPLLFVQAMAGKTPSVAGVSNDLVTDISPNEPDSPIKGLVLSKEQIIQIKQYVKYGLVLPTTNESVKSYLEYDESKYPEISPSEFITLFTKVKNHASLWSNLESNIKSLGTDLSIFGDKFVITGNTMIEVINEMPLLKLATQTIGQSDVSVSLTEDDQEIKYALKDLLEELKSGVAKHLLSTQALIEKLENYRNTMDNSIVPDVSVMDNTIQELDLNKDLAKLISEKTELDSDIDVQDALYSKNVGLAFTGAAGLIAGPIGIVSWAITGGIFGDKAEKARKERNRLIGLRDAKIKEIAALDLFINKVSVLKGKVSDMSLIINEAAVGIRNLETMWISIEQYIDASKNELDEITDSKRLIVFKSKMAAAVESWKNVKDITVELVRLFEEAQIEANKL